MSDMIMDDSAKKIKPIGDRVLLKLVEVDRKQTVKRNSGIILVNQDLQSAGQAIGGSMGVVYRAYIDSIGEKVDLEKFSFKIGDWVVFNNLDVMGLDLPDPEDPSKVLRYGMTKPESIWGIYSE